MTVIRILRGCSKSKFKIATSSPNRSALATRGARMLSPKMQRAIRVQDAQLCVLAERAHFDKSMAGYLHKRQADTNKWQLRWFLLYQNLLFYYESESCSRPSGVVMLEGCYCERLIAGSSSSKTKDSLDKQYCFAISYRRENQRQYELRASSESDCKMWIEAVRDASFNKLLLQKEELEQKHLHLLQIVESEKTAKWQYTQQCEELASEIKKLRAELCALKKEWRPMAVSRGGGAPFGGLIGGGMVAPPVSAVSGGRAGGATAAGGTSGGVVEEEESLELRKIKKVQSFFRGWLCRRRWKQIVEQYIKSPHAESMRKRNSLVFRMVESEEEYMEQMEVLVSCFLRPFKMAASSKKPPCSHEDVNSIFLNSETVLFLHQIFLKGLTSRMESWPTLVLGDLFDMLLPMLSIYQEYVRNHHYSLQVLTECKQAPPFAALLSRLENKPACQGRSLEMFLTYPMHQVPRYIITLHELLAHTPHDHVERKSLQNARQQLEDLSRQMHDEVSETENLRKNLAVERMIVEGCDILLDVNQVFVRQGSLIQFPADKQKRSRLSNFKTEKEAVRQCFLFSNHLIIATRTSGGRLHLVPDVGKIPLADALLIEDPSDQGACNDDDESSVCSMSSQSSGMSELSGGGGGGKTGSVPPHHNRDFKIIVDVNKSSGGATSSSPQMCVHLVAPTMQEKAAWISDISQCMDNVHFNDLLHSSMSDTSSVTMPQSMKNDPKLFKDDIDIRFSRTLNSCKVPQIRYATPERLLGRLTDLRFLSIDFLNTFLLTYRVFTDGVTVLEALKKVFYQTSESPDASCASAAAAAAAAHMQPGSIVSFDGFMEQESGGGQPCHLQLYDGRQQSPRRPSGASSVSGYGSEASDRRLSSDSQKGQQHWRSSFRKYDEEQQLSLIRERESNNPVIVKESSASSSSPRRKVSIRVEQVEHGDQEEEGDGGVDSAQLLAPPSNTAMAISSSAETLTDVTIMSAPSSPSNVSSVTLVGSSGGSDPSVSPQDSTMGLQDTSEPQESPGDAEESTTDAGASGAEPSQLPTQQQQQQQQQQCHRPPPPSQQSSAATSSHHLERRWSDKPTIVGLRKKSEISLGGCSVITDGGGGEEWTSNQDGGGVVVGGGGYGGGIHYYHPSTSRSASVVMQNYLGRRSLVGGGGVDGEGGGGGSVSQRTSFQHESPQHSSKAGVVITSFRQSQRRSSTSTAAAAFAIATSASSNPRDFVGGPQGAQGCPGGASGRERMRRKESVMSTAATMRVLNVLKHWISKHGQDFELSSQLKSLTIEFLEDIVYSPNLLPAEHKAASQLLRLLSKDEPDAHHVDLDLLLAPPLTPSKESIETLSALEIAEQMTYLDHKIFISISCEEFLGQAWMKSDKATRAPHIILMTRRFNEVSQLVVSEIVGRPSMSARVNVIEKWTAVADIARCLHNFNGVLQICAAFTNSSVYRLKKTWEKVSKTTRQTIEKLQVIVSSDGRFRNLRDALHRCDPPCIPYLGMYLTDLSFIEEGTPNFTDDGLLNFSKMRMIAHVIREIRHFQQTPYKIDVISKVTNYLLDSTLLLDDDDLYKMSLHIEPRTSRLSAAHLPQLPMMGGGPPTTPVPSPSHSNQQQRS